jgi:hypothetical protein
VPVSGEPKAESASLEVQQAYDQMMREQVAPALRELGFTGTARIFRYGSGGHSGELRWQKDARQTRRQLLLFTINLGWWWGGGRIYELMPVPAGDTWWELRGGQPAGPVASSVVSAIRCYAVPAIQAGLDDVEHQQDPGVRWPRRFPPVAAMGQRRPDGGSAARESWYLQPAGTEADEAFADLASDIALDRLAAADHIAEHALSDPRGVPALADRLERDPSPVIRARVASRMLVLRAGEPLARSALHASAAEDEDDRVRGAARYALRLDLDRDPGREALARWPRYGGIRRPARGPAR